MSSPTPLAPPDTPERRVYVNASLRLDSIQAIGFDMDYTLAMYDERYLERVAFELAAPHLEEIGYPAIVRSLQYRPVRGIRGLTVDLQLGNVLKVDQYDYVSIAWHGIQELDAAARREDYSNRAIDLESERYQSVDTLYELPNLDLFMQLVAVKESFPDDVRNKEYATLWQDVRDAIDQVHRDGSLKSEITRSPGDFLTRDPDLAPALRILRESGKKLFLLTNSDYPYTDAVMSYLLDGEDEDHPTWVDFFDEVVVEARKPTFFEHFGSSRITATRPLHRGGSVEIRSRGNYRGLHRRLGCVGDQVLFVGDHIHGDVIRSKQKLFWRTLLILPELGNELAAFAESGGRRQAFEALLAEIDASDQRCADLRNGVARARREPGLVLQALEEEYLAALEHSRELQASLEDLERGIDRRFHQRWGALLNDGAEVSRFGKRVQEYADLYTSRVPNLARYPGGKYFPSPWDVFPHSRQT